MRALALLATLGSFAGPYALAAEPRSITARDARQWVQNVIPLPQRIDITGELLLKPGQIGVSAQQADDPVFKQALKELEAQRG